MKRKFKNLIIVLVAFIITFLSFNYIVFGNLNFKNLSNVFYFFRDDNTSFVSYDKEFIDKNELVESTDANAIGTSVHTYNLEIIDVPNKVSLFSLNLDASKSNANNVVIYVYTSDGIFSYDEDDFYIDNKDEKIILIQQENVDKIILESVFEQFGSSTLVNEEILSLNEIEINDKFDVEYVEDSLLIDFFVSSLITIIIFIIFLILFKSNIDKKIFANKWKVENIFLVTAVTFGIIFSVLFPLYQIPDELTHINMIYDDLNLDMQFQDVSDYYGDTLRIMRNYDEKVDIDEYFDFSKRMEITARLELPSILFIRHFPQAIGLIICSFLNLPVLVCITVSEILAVLFYSFVCYLALKLLPIKKKVMMLVMLLPMCIQQMGSFSYDAVLLPLCFLFISYVLHLKLVKDKIQLFDLIKLIILLVIIALIKVPYVLLGGIIVLLPPSKIYLNFRWFQIDGNYLKKYKIRILSIFGLLMIPTVFLGIKILTKISYGRVLIAAIKANVSTIRLLVNTLFTYGKQHLVELTGSFGWLDTPVSVVFTIFVLFNMFFITFFNWKDDKKNNIQKNPFKLWEIIYLLVLGIFMCCVIILSMFGWTLYVTGVPNSADLSIIEYVNLIENSITVIGGVQGRYFIPIIPLFLLPLFSHFITKIISNMNYKFYLLLYYVIMFGYMFLVVLERYWI